MFILRTIKKHITNFGISINDRREKTIGITLLNAEIYLFHKILGSVKARSLLHRYG